MLWDLCAPLSEVYGLKIVFNRKPFSRGNDFEKNSEYAKTWKKDDDGGVIRYFGLIWQHFYKNLH